MKQRLALDVRFERNLNYLADPQVRGALRRLPLPDLMTVIAGPLIDAQMTAEAKFVKANNTRHKGDGRIQS